MRGEGGAELKGQGPPGVPLGQPLPQSGDPAGAGRLAMGGEHLGNGLAVPVLLVVPDGEERGDVRVPVGPGDQDVPEIAHSVDLDVVHVAEAAEDIGGQRLVPERGEVDVVSVELRREER